MASWSNPCVLNVNEWMKKADDLVAEITNLVALNVPGQSSMTVYPHLLPEIHSGVVELGYKSVNNFCESFPSKFNVDAATNVITLPAGDTTPEEKEEKMVETVAELKPEQPEEKNVQKTNIDEGTSALLANYKPVPPSLRNSIMKKEQQAESQQVTNKKVDRIHFKFRFEGQLRRFAISRDDPDLMETLKARVQKIVGKSVHLFWRDEDSAVVLESADDLYAAVDYAERMKKPPCIDIEFTVVGDQDEVVTPKMISRDDSCAAFNGFAFMCDACDVHLSDSNGGRFKCVVCDNYDLCAACVAKGAHDDANHALVRLLNAETIVPIAEEEFGGRRAGLMMETYRCAPTFVVVPHSLESLRFEKIHEEYAMAEAERESKKMMIKEKEEISNKIEADEITEFEMMQQAEKWNEMAEAERECKEMMKAKQEEISANIETEEATPASKQAALVRSFDKKFDAYLDMISKREQSGITRKQLEERLKLKFMQSMETWEKRWEWQTVEAEMQITCEEGDAKLASFFQDLGRATPMAPLAQENPIFEMMQHEDAQAWRIMEEERAHQLAEQTRQQEEQTRLQEEQTRLQEEREARIEAEAAFVTQREIALRELLEPARSVAETTDQIKALEEGRVKIEKLMSAVSLSDKQEEQPLVKIDVNATNIDQNAPTSWSRGTGAAIAAKWKEDELLGDKATEMAVLYSNLTFPDLKKRIPDWNQRADFINQTWTELNWDEKAVYMQRALLNQPPLQVNSTVAAQPFRAMSGFDEMELWREDELLGSKATTAAVLYVNMTFADLKHYMYDWDKRAKFIKSTWEELPAEVKQDYTRLASANRGESVQASQAAPITAAPFFFHAAYEQTTSNSSFRERTVAEILAAVMDSSKMGLIKEEEVENDLSATMDRLEIENDQPIVAEAAERSADSESEESFDSDSDEQFDRLLDDEESRLRALPYFGSWLDEASEQVKLIEQIEGAVSDISATQPVQEAVVEADLSATMERLEIRTDPRIVVEAASQTEVAVPDAAGEPAAAAHACACTCDEGQKTEGKWPSERWAEGWNYYEKQAPPTEKFVQDSREFLARSDDIGYITDNLERLMLQEACKRMYPEEISNEIEELYYRVSNNIRLHVFHAHEKILSDSKDVENEVIRLIATDLAKRLLNVHFGTVHEPSDVRVRRVESRIHELERVNYIRSFDHNYHHIATKLKDLLSNNNYSIFYDSNETSLNAVASRAREFYVQLNIQREQTRVAVLEERAKPTEDKKKDLTEEQQQLLGRLFATGIFEDYDAMIEVCRLARNLEQAIEMMLVPKDHHIV